MTPANHAAGAAPRVVRRSVASMLCLLLLVPANGCVTKQSFRPEAFDVEGDGDIHVYVRGRRMIEFESGRYRSVDSAGIRYLLGNGIDFRPDSADVRVPFSGYIPFPSIDRIETRHVDVYSALYVTAFLGVFIVLGFTTNITD